MLFQPEDQQYIVSAYEEDVEMQDVESEEEESDEEGIRMVH